MTSQNIAKTSPPDELLAWQIEVGADEAITETPRDWFADEDTSLEAPKVKPAPTPALSPVQETKPSSAPTFTPNDEALLSAREIAAKCTSLDDLEKALLNFESCSLKKTAQNLVFYDGNPQAKTLLLGEAPGADEDRIGKPFVGRSGKLLDMMLDTIGLSRDEESREKSVCISNVVFWRPPGNRKPTDIEAQLCLPFVEKLIEITAPDIIVCLGATPMHRLVGGTQGILRARGKWQNYELAGRSISLLPTLHPAYLLRAPAQKKHSWHDLLMLKEKLETA